MIDVILKRLPAKPDAIGFKAVHGGPISGAVRVTRRSDRDDGAVRRCRAGPQSALHRGDEGVSRRNCRASRRWRRLKRRFTRRFRCRGRCTRSRTNGRRSSAFADTDSTARAIDTSPRACRELVGREKCTADHHLPPRRSMLDLRDRKRQERREQFRHDRRRSGVPHNNRVGDFDTFALLKLIKQGMTLEEIFHKLGKEGGMLGMSGVSPDMRDIEARRRRRQAPGASWRSTRSSKRCGITSARIWSCSADATCWSSPAAWAKTASPSARRFAKTCDLAGIDARSAEEPDARHRKPESARSNRTAKSGSCRRMRS